MSSVSGAPRLYPDSGLHFKCYACPRSVSVQYGTFSKKIAAMSGGYSTGPQKPGRMVCTPDHSITRRAKAALNSLSSLETIYRDCVHLLALKDN
jgi:hypothetical protein